MTTQTFDLKHFQMSLLYSLFLAILVALFFGLGVAAFYTAPKAPDYPIVLEKQAPGINETPELTKQRVEYETAQKEFMKKEQVYSRNVSIITVVLAIITVVVSLTLGSKLVFFSDGLLLGGLLTLLYSIVRGFMSDDARFRFIIVTIGLIVTFVVGYTKFIKEKKEV